MSIDIGGNSVSLPELRHVWERPVQLCLSHSARAAVEKSQRFLESFIETGGTAYGINTGFGKLATKNIDASQLAQLQHNLVRSHAAGVGVRLPDEVVRLALFLKATALSQGYSGVRAELIDSLCLLVNHEIYPVVPSQGSVGASGDLAPLAHIACALIGEGNVFYKGRSMTAASALDAAQLETLELAPKEGLALLNGTQISTSLALAALFRFEHVLAASIVAGAMSTDAVQGSDTPFDERVHRVRGHRGQQKIGSLLFKLMKGSEIRASHVSCTRVQDPYSIRCQPQVVGSCLDALNRAAETLSIEANAVTDNPLVLAESNEVVSGGNFHAEPVAMAADYLALAIAEVGSLSERRTALLMDTNLSNLPAFLVEDSGLNSGFMVAQVTAAALASENKALAQPASVDSIPTSANQEDHVSMATYAARRLHDMVDNCQRIVAIELLAAAQGIEFHRPLKSSVDIEDSMRHVRSLSSTYSTDRSLSEDIEALAQAIVQGQFCTVAQGILPSMSS